MEGKSFLFSGRRPKNARIISIDPRGFVIWLFAE